MTTSEKIKIVDGDGHLWEDAVGILKRMPAEYELNASPSTGLFPPPDHFHFHIGKVYKQAFAQVGPEGWLAFLDDVGIDQTVLFPSLALAYGKIPYRDWAIDVCHAYNEWAHDIYLKRSSRFHGVAIVPMQDPEAAVTELRHAVETLGFSGAVLPATGLKDHLGAKDYWPVYEEANRLGCCIAIHGGGHAGLGFDTMNVFAPAHSLGHPVSLMIHFSGIIFNGLLDRFPRIRWGFMEGGVAWLLPLLERYDRSYSTMTPYNLKGDLLKLPAGENVADYVRRHFKEGRLVVGAEGTEPMLPYLCNDLGSRAFLFSSDFPHEVDAAMCRHEVDEILDSELSQADKAAVLHGNAMRFYGLT